MKTRLSLPSNRLDWVVCVALLFSIAVPCWALDDKSWELAPYRVQLLVVVDSSARPGAITAEQFSADLKQRIRTTLYPLWSVELVLPQAADRTRQLSGLGNLEDESEQSETVRFDKRIYITAKVSPLGISLSSRELDIYTGRWTPVLNKLVRQDHMVTHASLELLCQVFAPLAMIHADPNDEEHVSLVFKGADLPRQTDEPLFVHRNDLFQPLLVRLSRTSGAAPETIVDVPWTYVVAEEPEDAGWLCRVYTGTRRPFGTRRRGRVELMAIALKAPLYETQVRFHASHDESQSLRGYEVFEQEPETGEYKLLGVTNYQGLIPVTRTDAPVRMLILRSDNQLLAKVPVVPGVRTLAEIPIADDMARLLVQEDLEALKEKLIDVVARRNIIMARVRAFLEQDNLDEAQKLLTELNALPNRGDFAQEIKSLQDLTGSGANSQYHSDNPRIQAKIGKLLDNTGTLLGRFLGVREITQLENEVREYQRSQPN
ncbi:hypothetical protein [Bythopirellula polymerisocia]|nr:hypothetical protein [Bythopirellula polymerisocia]